ncbi:MAG: hypothetical protein K9N55_06755 [Phycisphaerae bacterium]|nr:hypothetical protein [Phycisphaerae bacterium]
MKNVLRNAMTGMTLGLLFWTGCAMDGRSSKDPNEPVPQANQGPTRIFTPNQVNIIPLTHYVNATKPAELDYIRVYVELLDDYQSQVKAPGIFRFELYNRALRSVEPMGKRIDIWRDIQLNNPGENNEYWREYLRTYEFRLPLQHILEGHFILQCTFTTPQGKRLTSHKTVYLGTKQ